MSRVIVWFLVLWLCVPAAQADVTVDMVENLQRTVRHLTERVTELSATVAAQQRRIAKLEARPQPVALGVPGEQVPADRIAALQGQAAGSLSAFNPELGLLADITGQVSESEIDTEGNDKLSVRELELIVGHPIDPSSRLDTTITFSDFEGPVVEEAYITHWGLPGEVNARVGRIRPKIGKASAIHRDQLDTADEPLVVQRYLGNEGLFRTGVELSGFLPTPWTVVTHELIGGVMEGGIGEGGTLFGATRRRPSLYTRLRNFWEPSDITNVELGTTWLTGSKDADARFEVNALGLDATLVHFVTPTNKLKWQNELYLQDRDESFSIAEDGTRTDFAGHPFGLYSLLDYRLSPRFGIGGRIDYVEPVDLNPTQAVRHADTSWSGYLTLYQSEFARWRLQYRRDSFANGGDDNTLFLQGTVAIGVHKHQLQ